MASDICCEMAAYTTPRRPLEDEIKRYEGKTLLADGILMAYSQVGQTLIASFDGSTPSAVIRTLLEQHAIGNVLLTAQNIQDGPQVLHLNQTLQDLARSSQHPAPLLIGIEQEGGLVSHLSSSQHATQFPSPMGLAATRSSAMVQQVGEAIGKELVAVGFNWNIAPVIDILTDLTEPLDASRVFGDNHAAAVGYTSAFMKGLHSAGLTTIATEALSTTLSEAYQQTIGSGNLNGDAINNDEVRHLQQLFEGHIVDSVMLSSSIYDFNDTVRASESIKSVIYDVLRDRLGFRGLVMSNCSSFPSATGHCLIHEPLRALVCGSDMVRLPPDPRTQVASINAIYAAIESSFLPALTVATYSNRILALKSRYFSWSTVNNRTPTPLLSLQSLHRPLADAIYRASITTFQHAISPLIATPTTSVLLLLTPTVPPLGTGAQTSDPFEVLGRTISRRRPLTRHVPYSLSVGLTTTHVAFLRRASVVVMVLASTSSVLAEAQEELWKAAESVLADSENQGGNRVVRIVVGAGDVRDLTRSGVLESGWWGIECWEYTKPALEAVAEALIGEGEVTGTLPVSWRR